MSKEPVDPAEIARIQRDQDTRMQCVHLANQHAKPDSTVEELAAAAERLYTFVSAA